MKALLFALTALLTTLAQAQIVIGGNPLPEMPTPNTAPVRVGSQVVITPVWPTTCNPTELKWHLNTVYDVQRLDETEDTVTFQFKTQYVQCNRGSLLPYTLEGYGAAAEVISKRFVLFHTRGTPMATSHELSRPDELQVTVKFFKNRIFSNDSQKTKPFQMVFAPRLNTFNGGYRFWWNVLLVRDHDGNYDMKITQGSEK